VWRTMEGLCGRLDWRSANPVGRRVSSLARDAVWMRARHRTQGRAYRGSWRQRSERFVKADEATQNVRRTVRCPRASFPAAGVSGVPIGRSMCVDDKLGGMLSAFGLVELALSVGNGDVPPARAHLPPLTSLADPAPRAVVTRVGTTTRACSARLLRRAFSRGV
jgi:hypothetical protein